MRRAAKSAGRSGPGGERAIRAGAGLLLDKARIHRALEPVQRLKNGAGGAVRRDARNSDHVVNLIGRTAGEVDDMGAEGEYAAPIGDRDVADAADDFIGFDDDLLTAGKIEIDLPGEQLCKREALDRVEFGVAVSDGRGERERAGPLAPAARRRESRDRGEPRSAPVSSWLRLAR